MMVFQIFISSQSHRKPLSECAIDELWREELDLELARLTANNTTPPTASHKFSVATNAPGT